MNLEKYYRQMLDSQDENEDMVRLRDGFLDTEVYKEIKAFLDIYKPEWRKNKELGRAAPEFILSTIDMWDDEPGDYTFKEWLTNIYEDLGSEYLSFTSFNRSSRFNQLWNEFESMYGTNRDGSFSKEEYDKLYKDFEAEDDEKEYLTF